MIERLRSRGERRGELGRLRPPCGWGEGERLRLSDGGLRGPSTLLLCRVDAIAVQPSVERGSNARWGLTACAELLARRGLLGRLARGPSSSTGAIEVSPYPWAAASSSAREAFGRIETPRDRSNAASRGSDKESIGTGVMAISSSMKIVVVAIALTAASSSSLEAPSRMAAPREETRIASCASESLVTGMGVRAAISSGVEDVIPLSLIHI